jgi:hypothetical protein
MKEEKLFTIRQIKKAFAEYVKATETFGARKLSPLSWKLFIKASWSKFNKFLKNL